jgi:hypothetical protein
VVRLVTVAIVSKYPLRRVYQLARHGYISSDDRAEEGVLWMSGMDNFPPYGTHFCYSVAGREQINLGGSVRESNRWVQVVIDYMRMRPKLSEGERWQLWERHLLGCSEGLSQPLAVYHEEWARKGRSVSYAVSVLPAIASEREVLEEEGPTPFEQALPRGARNDERRGLPALGCPVESGADDRH